MIRENASLGEAGAYGPVIVAAGRRVDAPDATAARFPAQNVSTVRTRIEELLQREHPIAIVASAACGADLLLLDASLSLAAAGKVPEISRFVLLAVTS